METLMPTPVVVPAVTPPVMAQAMSSWVASILTVGALTSGYGGANSLSGLVVMGDINNSTHASISSGAEVSAPTDNIDATQELMAWAITGGVTAGTTTGVGISVSIDQATTSTLAFVGDNSVEEKNYLSGLGLPYTPAVAVTPPVMA